MTHNKYPPTRWLPVWILICIQLVFFTLLRTILVATFTSAISFADVMRVFLVGFWMDALAAAWLALPLLLWVTILPEKWFTSRAHKFILAVGFVIAWTIQIFLLIAEYFFFEEFKSRFNSVAVDYLIYPTEVFVNIWDVYPVVRSVFVCIFCGIAIYFACSRMFGSNWASPATKTPLKRRLLTLGAYLFPLLVSTQAVVTIGTQFSYDRLVNELANNGPYSFVYAAYTHELDFAAFYRTLPRDEAYARARNLLQEPGSAFVLPKDSIQRHVSGDTGNPNKPRLNVVILLEEAFGSEFWGVLGRQPSLTPQMDALSKEGLLFSNMYASGNRTVRGMEGVLSSFPPLPGDAIVKRTLSDNVETIARLLIRDGYRTSFLYGGRGIFDGMRSFALSNGYEQFIEQSNFENPSFSTIWGVADEILFDKAIEEFRDLDEKGQPFFATILSVSNHKPYTYPKGRIPENPDDRRREHAVKYSDWALGHFFELAKKERFYQNTIFVVVADHGARVYGSPLIPIHSYEIPMLIVGPAVVKAPRKIAALGCSLDVAPTILGLIGRPYESVFFGRDLLKDSEGQGRVLTNHNRDIALYRNGIMAVLSLHKTAEYYKMNPETRDLVPITNPGVEEKEVESDAAAIFQVADDQYMHRRYRVF